MYMCTACIYITHLQDTSAGEQSAIVQKERDRLALHRKATHAALVIQLAWRKYVMLYPLLVVSPDPLQVCENEEAEGDS